MYETVLKYIVNSWNMLLGMTNSAMPAHHVGSATRNTSMLSPTPLWSSASPPLKIGTNSQHMAQSGSSTNGAQSPSMRTAHTFSHATTADPSHTRCATCLPACLKCGNRDHTTNTHLAKLPPRCINCRKDHTSNYVNCNHRRHLLGLNPLPETPEATKKLGRNMGKKTNNKPKPNNSREKTATNQVIGLDGNQLLEAINKDSGETPLKLHVSLAMHEKAQEQLNRSSQRLREKEMLRQITQQGTQPVDMEGVKAAPTHNP